MGKKSKTSYPSFSGGTVNINGRNVATTYKKNGVITTDYNMSDSEKDIYDSIQNNLYSSLGNLFSISDEKQELWNNQLDAMKQKGIQEIENIYAPMENNLKNDIANRFGNLDNSVFLDNLNKIADKRAVAVSDLSNNLLSNQNNLYSEEMKNRLNMITLLSNLNTIMNNNALSYINAANSHSSLGNSYNSAAYNAANSGNSSMAGAIASLGSSLMSYFK